MMRAAQATLGLSALLAIGVMSGALYSAPAPAASAAATKGLTTASGVYSAAQAEEGARLYAVRCAMCHGQMLEGTMETPALKGKFIANWARSPLGHLFNYVSEAMPQFAPGSLAPAENAAIIAFLLRENGMRTGNSPLPSDSEALKTITFMPDGAPN